MIGKILQKKKEIVLFLVIIAGVIILFLYFTKFHYHGTYINSKKADFKIKEIIEQEKESTLIEQKIWEEKYIQMVFQTINQTFKTVFLNAKNGEILKIEDMVKEEKREHFKTTIHELLGLKYPKFIADVLKYENGEITYILKENELVLYFYNFTITPAPKEELFLKINYNRIKEDLNFQIPFSNDKKDENGFDYVKNKKTIALTFDDGPNQDKTLTLIKLLNENKMHATFFMVGNRMVNAPDVLKEVLKNGNEIGSHSYHHKNLTRLKKEELLEEENKTNTIYKSITGEDLKLLRPPYGNVNQEMKENLNYVFINWNLDTEDWRYRDEKHVYDSVIEKVEDGDIILMHDLYDSTIEAVRKLLPELYVRGFQVVSVSELANLKDITLENHKVYRSIK